MSGTTGYFDIVNSNIAVPYTSASNYDMVIRTEGMGQRMFIGNSNGAILPAITISSNMVGIGKSNPSFPLDVVGNVSLGASWSNNVGNICAGNLGMFRNRIINGDMRIDQRRNGASSGNINGTSGSNTYPSVDRWCLDVYGGITFTGALQYQQVTDAPPGFNYSLRIGVATVVSTTNNTISPLQQAIEGFNVSDFSWGTSYGIPAVLSFWTKCSLTGTHLCTIMSGNGATTYVATFTVSSAGTWEYKTISIPAPPVGSTGWNTTNTVGISIRFYPQEFGTSSYRVASANTWQTSVSFGTILSSGYVNTLFTNTANYVNITGVQLEKGTITTPFEFRPYQIELQLCQRYFWALGKSPIASSGVYSVFGCGYWQNTSYAWIPITTPVQMRDCSSSSVTLAIAGNLLVTTPSGVSGISSIQKNSHSHNMFSIGINSSGGTANAVATLYDNNATPIAVIWISNEL